MGNRKRAGKRNYVTAKLQNVITSGNTDLIVSHKYIYGACANDVLLKSLFNNNLISVLVSSVNCYDRVSV